MLKLKDISKNFGATIALNGVTLTIPAGQMVGLVGRSGAGKSTLLRIINRLETPSAGDITFDDEAVLALRGPAVRAWRARCATTHRRRAICGNADRFLRCGRGGHCCKPGKKSPGCPAMRPWLGLVRRQYFWGYQTRCPSLPKMYRLGCLIRP